MTLARFAAIAAVFVAALGVRCWWKRREAEQTRRNNLRMYGPSEMDGDWR